MKRKLIRFAAAAVAVCLCGSLVACGGGSTQKAKSTGETLTVINYSEYMDPDVIQMFEDETGIEVKYEEALTPEEMYTKYKSGAIQYDLICSSDYMIKRLIEEGEAQKINIDGMEYKDNIGDKYWEFSKAFDPENEYSVPYFWGTLGILYDKTKVKAPVDSWSVLFDGSYAGDIIMQNSMRDTYMVALKYLGYSVNTTDQNQINEAQQLLLKQKSDVQAYLVDEARDEVVAGNATMAVVYSGEAYLAKEYNENLEYVIPKEGSNVWLDSWCVSKNCKNTEAAEKFLNFLCREDVAEKNFEYIYFSTPNEAVIDSMSEEDRNNEAMVPSEDATKNCEVCTMIDPETTSYMNNLWKELKAN